MSCCPKLIVLRRVVLVGVALCAAVCLQTRLQSGSINRSSAERFTEAAPLLTNELLAAASEFVLPEGYWHFPGTAWAFSQTQTHVPGQTYDLRFESDRLCTPTPATEIDRQILTVVQSLMNRTVGTDGRVHYSIDRDGISGSAVSQLLGGDEVPLEVCVSWPAADGQYSQMDARRLPAGQDPQPLLPLPESATVVATRMTTSGNSYCQFVRLPQPDDSLADWFLQIGWQVEHPDSAERAPWYWVSNETECFEVKLRRPGNARERTVMIRRIDAAVPQPGNW